MKRLLVAMLCMSALSIFASGASAKLNAQEKPAQEQKEQKDKKATYDVYIGQYEVAKDFVLTITNENGKLMGQPTGDTKAEFKAEETADTFYSADVGARLKFAKNEKGEVTGVIVSLGGKDYWSKKIK
jgi:uncharacterized protein involved in high-affinity Fe2+ transport